MPFRNCPSPPSKFIDRNSENYSIKIVIIQRISPKSLLLLAPFLIPKIFSLASLFEVPITPEGRFISLF